MKKIASLTLLFLVVMSFGVEPWYDGSSNRGLIRPKRFTVKPTFCREAFASENPGKCGLYGRIQYVTSFPDVRVQVVTSFPDINVQIVSSFPDGPGRWQIVDSFPDYKVQLVDSFPDYRITYVSSFPGCK